MEKTVKRASRAKAAKAELPITSKPHHAFQIRLPLDVYAELSALLEERYAPLPPPSMNSVLVESLKGAMKQMRLENEKKREGGVLSSSSEKK